MHTPEEYVENNISIEIERQERYDKVTQENSNIEIAQELTSREQQNQLLQIYLQTIEDLKKNMSTLTKNSTLF